MNWRAAAQLFVLLVTVTALVVITVAIATVVSAGLIVFHLLKDRAEGATIPSKTTMRTCQTRVVA